MKLAFLLVFFPLVLAPLDGLAWTPALHLRQAYAVLLDDEPSPGSVTHKVDLTIGDAVGERLRWAAGVGFSSPSQTFQPSPRAVAALAYALSERWSMTAGLLWHHGIGYAGGASSDSLGVSAGPAYAIASGLSLRLAAGVGRTLDGGWSAAFEPAVSIAFQ